MLDDAPVAGDIADTLANMCCNMATFSGVSDATKLAIPPPGDVSDATKLSSSGGGASVLAGSGAVAAAGGALCLSLTVSCASPALLRGARGAYAITGPALLSTACGALAGGT